MKSLYTLLFAIAVISYSLTASTKAHAGITMTCFDKVKVPGYTPSTMACMMSWFTADEVEYPTGDTFYTLTEIGGSTISGPFLFTASTMPNNRHYTYVDYTTGGISGLFFLHVKGTLMEQLIDENGISWRWHPDTYKQDSITATLPPP